MSTVLQVVLLVLAVGVFLVVAVAPMAWLISDLRSSPLAVLLSVVWMLLVVGVGVGLLVLQDKRDAADCADRGGVWSVTGHYYVKGVRHNRYGCLDAPR